MTWDVFDDGQHAAFEIAFGDRPAQLRDDLSRRAIGAVADDVVRATVRAALGTAPMSIDTIIRVTGIPSRAVQIALMELDLAGDLVRHSGQLVSRRVPSV
ncbi:MAG: hypothetical protein HC774_03335 [Sphingomonadales bacterium]|nr:hypothetical protein [Sphingomonadales bacterium]